MRPTLLALIALLTGCSNYPAASVDAPPDVGWQPGNGAIIEPIDTLPVVDVLKMDREIALVEITNKGHDSLEYGARNDDSICTFREIEEYGKWIVDTYDWCGMGIESAILEPGHKIKVTVLFRPNVKRERLLASFRQLGTDKQSYVILAVEPAN
jgi:hypothetical protein